LGRLLLIGFCAVVCGSLALVGRASARTQLNNAPYGTAVVFDAKTGALVSGFPIIRNADVVAADGVGGFYVAESTVRGVPLPIKHIRSDGSVDRRLRIGIVGGHAVALAVSGETLYIGGAFAKVAGKPHRGLAAVDLLNGTVLRWGPRLPWPALSSEPNAGARALSIAAGNVIAGGDGQIAAFNARTGAKRWSLAVAFCDELHRPIEDGYVEAQMVVRGRLFLAGVFDCGRPSGQKRWISFRPGKSLIEIDPNTGEPTRWRARRAVGPRILSLAASKTTLFVGGHDGSFLVSLASGRVTVPKIGATVFAVAGRRLYLGGNLEDQLNTGNSFFTGNNLAALDLVTGGLTKFHRQLTRYQSISQIVVSGRRVIVRGEFLRNIG